MKVFRLSKIEYANSLNGKGAAKYGNRWNSKGVEVIYTAESRALAMSEVIVHLPLFLLPKGYMVSTIEIPNNIKVETVNFTELKVGWNKYPHSNITQKIGDRFILENKKLVLKVPSAIVQGEFNYLINPHHKDFKKIKISSVVRFSFDDRFFHV